MKKTTKTPPRSRSPLVVAMIRRHGKTTTTYRDRRAPRGGTKNHQREFLAEGEG